MKQLSNADCWALARKLAQLILSEYTRSDGMYSVYGVPRGGIPVAYLVASAIKEAGYACMVTDSPGFADVIVDDVVDSGATMRIHVEKFNKPFVALVTKKPGEWVSFPWEGTSETGSAEDIVTRLLQYIGEDPAREGLLETPKRFLKACGEWFSGYKQDPASLFKVFEDGAERANELVIVNNIPLASHCEHHIVPIMGVAHVGYIPDGKIVGISKLARLVDVFSRRLQVQERLTNQIADTIVEHLAPKGVGVIIRAKHLCMATRGVKMPDALTTTSAMRGCLMEEPAARAEFMNLCRDAETFK